MLAPSDRLLIFSDGVFEIEKTDGSDWSFDEFLAFLTTTVTADDLMDHLLVHVRQLRGSDTLADDFSILELAF